MKRTFSLLMLGACCAAPVFAQKITVTTSPSGKIKAGDKVHVCADADDGVKNVAGFKLTFAFGAGMSITPPDPTDRTDFTDAFVEGPGAPKKPLKAVHYNPTAHTLTVGLVSRKGIDGPGEYGCFDLVANKGIPGPVLIGLAVDAADANGKTIHLDAVGTKPTPVPRGPHSSKK